MKYKVGDLVRGFYQLGLVIDLDNKNKEMLIHWFSQNTELWHRQDSPMVKKLSRSK